MAILSSLIVVCALVPFIEAASRRRRQGSEAPVEGWVRRARLVGAVRRPAVAAALVMAPAAPVDTALLSDNKQVILIEQGQVGKANAQ